MLYRYSPTVFREMIHSWVLFQGPDLAERITEGVGDKLSLLIERRSALLEHLLYYMDMPRDSGDDLDDMFRRHGGPLLTFWYMLVTSDVNENSCNDVLRVWYPIYAHADREYFRDEGLEEAVSV